MRRWWRLQAFVSTLAGQKRRVARQKVRIDDRPCGGSVLVSCPRKRAGDCFRMVWSDESRDSDHPAPRHSPLLTLKGVYSSRRDAAVKPAELQGQPMEVREPPRAVREEPVYLRKERARLRKEQGWLRKEQAWLRGEPTRWQERPMGLRTAATGPRP
jgi:hypothetical protein